MSEGRPGPVLRHIAFQPADGEFDQRLRPRFSARVHGIISMKSRKGDLVSPLRKRQSSRYERPKRQAMHRRNGFDLLPRNRLPLTIFTRVSPVTQAWNRRHVTGLLIRANPQTIRNRNYRKWAT